MRFVFAAFALLSLGCGSSNDNSPDVASTPGSGGSSGGTGGAGGSTGGSDATGGSMSASGGTGGDTGGSSGSGGAGGSGTSGTGGSGPSSNWKSCGCADSPGGGEVAPDDRMQLTPGVWTFLGPPVENITGGGVLAVAVDPNNPWILYAGMEATVGGGDGNGIWKSKNGGRTWTRLGSGKDENPWDNATDYLDLPTQLAVSPCNSKHMYALEGVRGANNGFWVSCDAGETWVRPPGFTETSPTHDMSAISIDPSNFDNVLLGAHDFVNIGVLHSPDGGETFTLHPPPAEGWPAGTQGVSFLLHPETGKTDDQRWLVHNNGHWLTENGGGSWTKVSEISGVHGATQTYYTSDGVLYSGAGTKPARSRDNGKTWEAAGEGLPNATYYSVGGDGNNLYIMPDNFPPPSTYLSSPEADGNVWTVNDRSETPKRGPYYMTFDAKDRILYSANWEAGVWALKVEN